MMPRPCLKRSASSNWYKDKPHAYRGKHQVLVRFKPWAPQLLGALIVTSLLLSIFGLLRVHETLRIAVHLKATDDYALPSEPGLVDTVQHRLLLATHNVLAWYYPQYDVMEVLHQGEVCMSNMCCPNVATIQHKKQRFACTDAVATQMYKHCCSDVAPCALWFYPCLCFVVFMLLCHLLQGVHYGMFPGDPEPQHPHTVWNVIRPHNWRPATEKEYLVKFDAVTGE